jgi:DegV family protein with EDD domain
MCLSSGLSKSYEQSILAANEAMENFPDRKVITIDSKSASLGQGLIAVHAARSRDAGKSLQETAVYIESIVQKTHLWIMVDDLKHLKRGGRISGTRMAIGTMLNVKPLLTISQNAKLTPTGKARGRNKALALFLENLEKYEYMKNETIYIAHGDIPDVAEQLKSMIINKIGEVDVVVNEIGPVIGAHTGPGTIALIFIANVERPVIN